MDCCCGPKNLTLKVFKSGCRCGGNIPLRDTLFNTISSHSDCKCLQLFLGSPTTYQCKCFTQEDKQMTLNYCLQNDTSFYVHCPFLANLANKDCNSSMKVIGKELDVVSGLPAACVLHIGKVGTIENVSQRINELQLQGHLPVSNHSRVPYHLLLEIAAGAGTELGISWEEIRHLYEALDYTRVGICIDTQHAFASGLNPLQTHEDIIRLFDENNYITGKNISMIHLNDSMKPFGSRVDRHAALKQGHIWSRNDEGLKSLVKLSKEYGIDLISETNDPLGDIRLIERYTNDF